jgi:hypothetical protein
MMHTQLAILIISAIESLCIVATLSFIIYGYSTDRWNFIKAIVIKCEISKITIDDRSISYKLIKKQKSYIKKLIYEYVIDGARYRGMNIYVFGFSPVGGNVTDKFVDEHEGLKEGQEIKIYVNQNDSRQAVIEKGIPRSMVLISTCISVACFISIYLFSNFISKYRGIILAGSIIGIVLGILLFLILFYKGKSELHPL